MKTDFLFDHIEFFIVSMILGIIFGVPILYGILTGQTQNVDAIEQCMSSRTAQHVWLNENNEITYYVPRKICDLTYYNNMDYYRYSYEATMKYNKTRFSFYPSCENAKFDNITFNFICRDGTVAKEIRN